MWKSIEPIHVRQTMLCLVFGALFSADIETATAGDEVAGTQCVGATYAESAPLTDEERTPSIRPASERVEATPAVVKEAIAALRRNASQECAQWGGRTFEEFEHSTFSRHV